jgi:epoxyqueuosine reductase QueG
MSDLKAALAAAAAREVLAPGPVTSYRRPLLGYARADDLRFADLRQVAAPDHRLPGEILPGASSVVVVFVPFGAGLVRENAASGSVARSWLVAYVETNQLLARVAQALVQVLESRGHASVAILPTHEFDAGRLVSRWSHRHAAVIAGLGTLGLNRMLITAEGAAGRLVSVISTAELEAGAESAGGACTGCRVCVRRCPVGALSEHGEFDRHRCYAHLLSVAGAHPELGLADACGKCLTGPCGIREGGVVARAGGSGQSLGT